jgi:hypothetical protein
VVKFPIMKNLVRRVSIPLLILVFYNSQAQNDTTNTRTPVSCNLKISYNSALIYPGVRAGIEVPLHIIHKIKVKKSGYQKMLLKERYVTGNLSWYHHPTFQDNIYFTVEYGLRRTLKSGFFSEFSPGFGYSRTFLGATTYTVDDNGNVSIKRYAGYNYAMFILSAGFGWDFSKESSIPIALFSKLSMLTMFPYSSSIFLQPTLEFGFIYKPQKLFRVKLKINSIVKL